MAAHSAQHTQNRLAARFATLVERAEADIMHELANPRVTSVTVNADRAARWTAVQRLIALRRVVVVLPEELRWTKRPPPGGGERRQRLEVRVRRLGAGDMDAEDLT